MLTFFMRNLDVFAFLNTYLININMLIKSSYVPTLKACTRSKKMFRQNCHKVTKLRLGIDWSGLPRGNS